MNEERLFWVGRENKMGWDGNEWGGGRYVNPFDHTHM
jgi:hypothetical protein